MISVRSHIRNYRVRFGRVETSLKAIEKKSAHRQYIIDAIVWRLYKRGLLRRLQCEDVLVMPANEDEKCIRSVMRIYDHLIRRSAKRNLTMISIGGGIIQDITGFAASTLYRGINWIFIPTTLLAQADSCIGSKTSLNYKRFKNVLGTFYPPGEIYIDTQFLSTQQDIDFYSGVGEIVKLHILGGEPSVRKIVAALPKIVAREENTIAASVRESLHIKKRYIEEDEFDLGRRNLLNYGHCFGHAIEAVSHFSIPHGQAVVLGMVLANRMARRRGLISDALESFIMKQLLLPSLVLKPQEIFSRPDPIIEAMKKDKKRTGENLTVILPAGNYRFVKAADVTAAETKTVLADCVRLERSRSRIYRVL